MHVLSKPIFEEAKIKFPNNANAIADVYNTLKRYDFATPEAMREKFPTLDNMKYKDRMYVINIGRNNLRLLAIIEFKFKKVFVRHIVKHSDYDDLIEQYRKGDL